MARGNKGFFFGAPLKLLLKHLPEYLSTGTKQKAKFWNSFWPEWDGAYPELNTDELRQELEDAEKKFLKATAHVKKKNLAATKGKSRRKAKLTKLPSPSTRLNELRARGSDHAGRAIPRVACTSYKPPWGSSAHANAVGCCGSTRSTAKRCGPFTGRSTTSTPTTRGGGGSAGRRRGGGWGGGASAGRGRERGENEGEGKGKGKGKGENEGENRGEGEGEGENEGDADDQEEGGVKKQPLAAEPMPKTVAERTLEVLGAQMQCKGLILLGEIVVGEEGDEDEVFLSMVTQGELPNHAGVDIARWGAGTLSSPTDQGIPDAIAPTLCAHCVGRLIPLPASDAGTQKVGAAEDGAQKDGGKGKNKCKRSARRSARRVVDSEEETAADSGAGEGDDEGSWGGGSEPGRDDEEDEVDELQSSTRAMSRPPHDVGAKRERWVPVRRRRARPPAFQR
ncbi:hypothetical protein B0H14DRAFT_2599446 [Mycena olivaceomarginata]|nr:hypothetical protein B0H14DRAFT_2599446 [Mycena olivaceomarginata]